jgi:hypothetical protein
MVGEDFTISSLVRPETGPEWIEDNPERCLFRIAGIDRSGRKRVISSREGGASVDSLPKGMELRFDLPDSLQVTVSIKGWENDLFLLELGIQEPGPFDSVERLDFPFVANLANPPENPYLAFPSEQGVLIQDPRSTIFTNPETKSRLYGSYPGTWSMQFIAYGAHGGPGLYLATHDPASQTKRFVMEGQPDGSAAFFVENLLRNPAQPDGVPYPAVVGTYEGTWFDAARIYRRWALKQRWCSRGKVRDGAAPGWLQRTPAWIWNRGRVSSVVPQAIGLSDYLGMPVALDWYWWHGNPYDTMLPEYLPPRDGERAFRSGIEDLHRNGLRAIVYINGRVCDLQSKDWRPGEAVLGEDGQPRTETYCKYTQAPLGVMCPSSDYWRSRLRDITLELVDYGLDGVYLDQIASAPPRLCFSDGHGHHPGGASAWTDGYRELLRDIREEVEDRNPEAMLCSEGCCEAYMDLLDAFLTLSPSYERMGLLRIYGDSWQIIPMFNSVYHEYVVTFGSYSSLTDPPYDELWPPRGELQITDFAPYTDQFDLEIARCLVYGQKPMIANFHVDQTTQAGIGDSLTFFKRVCSLHERLEDQLTRGEYAGSVDLGVPNVRVECVAKGIYTLPGETRTRTRTVPAVLTSSWRSPGGSIAIVLANHSRVSHDLSLDRLGIPDGVEVTLIEPKGTGCHENPVGRRINIKAKQVACLVFPG